MRKMTKIGRMIDEIKGSSISPLYASRATMQRDKDLKIKSMANSVGGICNGIESKKEEQITSKKTGKTCEAVSEGENKF